MEGAPSIVIAGVCLAFGVLMGHFWWPAKARWKKQDDEIARFGEPLCPTAHYGALREYAEELWRLHMGGK